MEISTVSVSFNRYEPAAVLKFAGEDVFSFLQGQFTQDLRPCLEGPNVAYGLWLNVKGKVLADGFILRRGQEWFYVSLFSAAQAVRERLEANVIADDVTIEDVTAQWMGVSLLGSGVGGVFSALAEAALPEAGVWKQVRGGIIFQGRRAAEPNWEWLYPKDGDDHAEWLRAQGAQEISSEDLERLRIEAAIPAIPRDLGPEDLPNEGGLERDAISYTKGCYLGQEVMARLKNLGKVRRRLVRVEGAGLAPVELPAPLFADGKKLGELRSAVSVGNGFVGLALISLLGMTGRRSLSVSPEGEDCIIIKDPSV